ncbi:MAG: CcmD family protein [Saprospiraceae bacterium]|nr:CcmD family protein [Saprospiraceae bacterium]
MWGSWILFFSPSSAMAQGHDSDFLRSTGKIYSVIAGVVVIFIGISIYLWKIDNKLTNLEKHINDEHETS